MATFKILKNGKDISKSDKKEMLLKEKLEQLEVDNKDLFSKYSGEFSIQISDNNVSYVYIGSDTNSKDFSIPRELMDELIDEINSIHF